MRTFVFLIFFILSQNVQAQFHQALFTELEGEDLLEAVQDYFTPSNVPASGFARDVMYGTIYNVNGNVSCVYTGFTIDLPAGDPSEEAFELGINAEHTMPRSILEGSGGEFNIHNLFPTRIEVNADRNTFPFLEIEDEDTDKWYYLDNEQGNIPSQNIDLYSEQINGAFEPREDHKGNVARAMMYCYALYGNTIENNAPQYFEQQRENLCEWHFADPVDQQEYDRTYLIGSYQNDLPNPFVLDCTLASRIFCQDLETECILPVVSRIDNDLTNAISLNAPNPFSNRSNIEVNVPMNTNFELAVYNATGQLLQSKIIEKSSFETQNISFDSEITQGLYLIVLRAVVNGQLYQKTLKLISQ